MTKYTFDKAAAEAALDAAGYPRGADGTRFSLRMRVAPFFPESVAAGDYVKQALEEVGIGVEIVPADSSAAYIDAVFTQRDFDIAINTPSYRPDPAISTTILYQGGLDAGSRSPTRAATTTRSSTRSSRTVSRRSTPMPARRSTTSSSRSSRTSCRASASWTSCSRPPTVTASRISATTPAGR